VVQNPEVTMPIDRTSPSGGWRDVAEELCADGGVAHESRADAPSFTHVDPCPDCGRVPGVEADDLCCEIHTVRLERVSRPESASDSG
jgi:acetone carboxylase gamma subunit